MRNVSKIFHGETEVRALDNVSIDILENEFFTLLGPSGCGKTTLLRLIAGFDHPTAGEIFLNGQDIATLPPYKRPVNTVFQSYALFPHMSVADNIGFGLKMLGKSQAETSARVNEMLKLVRMESMAGRRTDQISGGQQQRVALARALAPQPRVLLLDEPLSALDYKLRKEMQIELKRMQNETGITFIFVTHDQEEALTMSDRIAVMSQGDVLQVGTPREIYHHPAVRFVADFIGDSNFLNAQIVSVASGKARVKLDAGPQITAGIPHGAAPKGKVTVVIRPEHATISGKPTKDHVKATVENVVYFGTDTLFHCALDDGTNFTVREQNREIAEAGMKVGDKVGIAISTGAAQVLRD
ncbi:MAG: ABC transporter ATP-binding protein [Rhizobiaceae bacterium]